VPGVFCVRANPYGFGRPSISTIISFDLASNIDLTCSGGWRGELRTIVVTWRTERLQSTERHQAEVVVTAVNGTAAGKERQFVFLDLSCHCWFSGMKRSKTYLRQTNGGALVPRFHRVVCGSCWENNNNITIADGRQTPLNLDLCRKTVRGMFHWHFISLDVSSVQQFLKVILSISHKRMSRTDRPLYLLFIPLATSERCCPRKLR